MELERISLHGHDLAYRHTGSGPLVVLLHGMLGSSDAWRFVIPTLAKHYTVIAPDLFGHGASDKPRADYSIGSHASSVRDLLSALGYERATMVGQSFGGGVAMQLTYQFPELCERLVLVSSGGLGAEVNTILRMLTIPGAANMLPIGCSPFLRELTGGVAKVLRRLGWKPSPQLVEIGYSYDALSHADVRRAFIHTLRSVVDRFGQRVSARDRLYLSTDLPTLIMWGTKDPIIPVQHAFDTHRAIEGSQLEIFEDAGHYPHCEDPVRFVRVLLGFLRDSAPAEITTERWRELLAANQRPAS